MPKSPRQKQQEALARREKDLQKWTRVGNEDKIAKAQADILRLKQKLGQA